MPDRETDRHINVLRQDYMDPFIMTHTYTLTDPGFLKREVTDRDGNAQGDFFLKNDIKKENNLSWSTLRIWTLLVTNC